MAKSKNLLLTESTTMRMMGLAGIGSLANPFLREMKDGYCESCGKAMHEGSCLEEMEDPQNVAEMGGLDPDNLLEEEDNDMVFEGWGDEGLEERKSSEEEDEEEEYEEEEEEEEDDEEEDESVNEGEGFMDPNYTGMNENVKRSLKRLKRLLEQAEPPAPGGEEVPPEVPPAPEGEAGGNPELEDKIKDFVKKMGELIQDTLGVEVKVEEGEGEEEEPAGTEAGAPPAGAGAPPPPAGGEAPAPMAEAINRLVNKVARRVKARLMEAKKESEKKKLSKKELEDLEGLEAHYGEEMRAGIKGKHSHKSRMAALQAAKSNLKEKQMAAKKKEMMMKKKKAAMAKKK